MGHTIAQPMPEPIHKRNRDAQNKAAEYLHFNAVHRRYSLNSWKKTIARANIIKYVPRKQSAISNIG